MMGQGILTAPCTTVWSRVLLWSVSIWVSSHLPKACWSKWKWMRVVLWDKLVSHSGSIRKTATIYMHSTKVSSFTKLTVCLFLLCSLISDISTHSKIILVIDHTGFFIEPHTPICLCLNRHTKCPQINRLESGPAETLFLMHKVNMKKVLQDFGKNNKTVFCGQHQWMNSLNSFTQYSNYTG